ncbi:MAG: response regulator, partial [Proteobacteria bacterium]|nr:response regulator [Pseudomonadota bacterium]
MKIRILLIVGLFALAFTPLLVFMGLNLPRVLAHFRVAEENRQLLVIQKNAGEIAMEMKWRQESLRALSFNAGVVDLVRHTSGDIPRQVLRRRVGKMVAKWYQENPEVLAMRLFDRQGLEQYVMQRGSDGVLAVLPEREANPTRIPSLIALADQYSDSEVFSIGLNFVDGIGDEQYPVMQLGVGLVNMGEVVGVACLYLNISPMLQRYSGSLLQYSTDEHKYVPFTASVSSADNIYFPIETDLIEPRLVKDRDGQPQALIPFFVDGHLHDNVFLAYPINAGNTMVWVQKWQRQMIFLLGLVFLGVCLVAMKLSAVIDAFAQELFAAFHALLHNQTPLAFSWSGPKELKSLSRDLNSLSQQYIESLKAQEEMRLEIRKMERQLRQSQKMKALGLLAGGVAHDLNNILSGIISYPQLLLLQLPKDSELRAPIVEIQRSGERAAAVVADLLTVARGVASKKEQCELNWLCREYLESPECVVLKKHHPQVSCVSRFAPEELPVFCSPVHVKKALMNLVTNAAESIKEGGEIVISTRREQRGGKKGQKTGMLPIDYGVLQIQDNGPGIAEKDIEHIFEPFYSKKKMGRSGTGLGLTVVWNTMHDHDGEVQVTSSAAGGTCFELFFPLSQGGATGYVMKAEELDLQGNGERILVIDDEAQQRDLAVRILSVYGYQAESVASGEEAVEFVKHQESDLLLLDMIMDPGINGYETYRQILEIRPQQKAILVSGF